MLDRYAQMNPSPLDMSMGTDGLNGSDLTSLLRESNALLSGEKEMLPHKGRGQGGWDPENNISTSTGCTSSTPTSVTCHLGCKTDIPPRWIYYQKCGHCSTWTIKDSEEPDPAASNAHRMLPTMDMSGTSPRIFNLSSFIPLEPARDMLPLDKPIAEIAHMFRQQEEVDQGSGMLPPVASTDAPMKESAMEMPGSEVMEAKVKNETYSYSCSAPLTFGTATGPGLGDHGPEMSRMYHQQEEVGRVCDMLTPVVSADTPKMEDHLELPSSEMSDFRVGGEPFLPTCAAPRAIGTPIRTSLWESGPLSHVLATFEFCGVREGNIVREGRPQAAMCYSHICLWCGQVETGIHYMARHLERIHHSNMYKCILCGVSSGSLRGMTEHWAAKHSIWGNMFQCAECQKTFRFMHVIKEHILTHHLQQKVECSACGKEYMSRAACRNHCARSHPTLPKSWCAPTLEEWKDEAKNGSPKVCEAAQNSKSGARLSDL